MAGSQRPGSDGLYVDGSKLPSPKKEKERKKLKIFGAKVLGGGAARLHNTSSNLVCAAVCLLSAPQSTMNFSLALLALHHSLHPFSFPN